MDPDALARALACGVLSNEEEAWKIALSTRE
jgi:hypothetical protein